MFDNKVPKYSKIELMIKGALENVPHDGLITRKKDNEFPSKTKLEFFDAGLVITGNHLIVIIDEQNDDEDGTLHSTGKIFSLNTIDSYRTHNK